MDTSLAAPQVESASRESASLGADELLAGSALRFEIELPAALLGSARIAGRSGCAR